MAIGIGRRQFISVLGGVALFQPFAARAQQSLPVIGILHEGHPAPSSLTAAFQQGLIEGALTRAAVSRSKIVGQKVNTIDYRHWRRT
jgi:hypothetical protein